MSYEAKKVSRFFLPQTLEECSHICFVVIYSLWKWLATQQQISKVISKRESKKEQFHVTSFIDACLDEVMVVGLSE